MRILLLASERSGSNLLRLMLNTHTEVAGPSAPQIARILGPRAHLYGDLKHPKNAAILIRHMLLLTKAHPDPWNPLPSNPSVLQHIQLPSFWGVFDAVYQTYANMVGKPHWFSKENNLFDYAAEIRLALRDARFVYLVRDGRDYALSLKRAPSGHQHIAFIARQWSREQAISMRIAQVLDESGCLLKLSYEELLAAPQETLIRLCAFLGIDFEPAMLAFSETADAKRIAAQSTFWENLNKPLMTGNAQKFKTLMRPRDIQRFESIAGRELQSAGYRLEFPPTSYQPGPIRRGANLLLDKIGRYRRKGQLLAEPGRSERQEAIQQINRELENHNG